MNFKKLMFWKPDADKMDLMKFSEKINYPCKYQPLTSEKLDNILALIAPFYSEISVDLSDDKKDATLKITFKFKTEIFFLKK
jgi:hypothetical protein